MKEWHNDPQWVSHKAHTDRWDRALLAFGEEMSDKTLTSMTTADVLELADRGWRRWVKVAAGQSEEHARVMRLSGALAETLNSGYKLEGRRSLEWRPGGRSRPSTWRLGR